MVIAKMMATAITIASTMAEMVMVERVEAMAVAEMVEEVVEL